MGFIDSFTHLKSQELAPLVKRHYDSLNAFLDGKSEEFLEHWHEGPESILFFNLSERERGGENVRLTFRQVRAVLSRVPVGTTLHPTQVQYMECADVAYAILMEKAISELDKRTVVGEHRATLIWRKFEHGWKLVHMHNDTYDRRMETMSELLRGYHPDA